MSPQVGGDGHAAVAGTPDNPFGRVGANLSRQGSDALAATMTWDAPIACPDGVLKTAPAWNAQTVKTIVDPQGYIQASSYVSTNYGRTLVANGHVALPIGFYMCGFQATFAFNATGHRDVFPFSVDFDNRGQVAGWDPVAGGNPFDFGSMIMTPSTGGPVSSLSGNGTTTAVWQTVSLIEITEAMFVASPGGPVQIGDLAVFSTGASGGTVNWTGASVYIWRVR